jgi:hypothetical protein
MFRSHLIPRNLSIGACGAAVLLCATTGFAKDKGAAACMTIYKSAQDHQQAGQLREARDQLAICAKATCGGLARKCAMEASQLDSDIPSIVPVVTDDSGVPVVDVQVKMDGASLTSHLDGRALAVDPGVHEFTFSTDRGVFATEKIMIVQGQRNRPITVSEHAPTRKVAEKKAEPAGAAAPQTETKASASAPAPADAPPARSETATHEDAAPATSPGNGRSLLLPLVLGSVGVVGLAGGGLLTLWGRKDNDALSQCTPNCLPSSLDHIRALYIAADISFVVGVAGLGAATWLYLRPGASDEKPPAQAASVRFDMHPTPSGAFASVRGAF